MIDFDVTLKSILTRPGSGVLAAMTGFAVKRWLNVELPMVRERRADLVGETAGGKLVHIELQSTNQARMDVRMLEYAIDIRRQFGSFPEQIVLYVGHEPVSMESSLVEAWGTFSYRLFDIRELDAEPFLASRRLDDNVIGILMRLRDERAALRRVLARIRAAKPARRRKALVELTILAGLRKLGAVIEEETKRVPILSDLIDHDLLGPVLKRGREEGREEGQRQGLEEGQRLVILRQIAKRFGPVPDWALRRIQALSAAELELVELRLLDAPSIEEVLR